MARAKLRSVKTREFVVPTESLPIERITKRNAEPLVAKTEAQKRFMAAIKNYDCVIGVGPAGTGKTYITASIAAELLESKSIERIIISRPAKEAGEEFGFIPGSLDEKYEPYLAPLREVFTERFGKSYFECLVKSGKIVPIPLAFMRGLTFKDCFVILDEAQNATIPQMKMFLTRLGENCTAVIDGDPTQVDISAASGLTDAIARISFIPAVKVVYFQEADSVRSALTREILKAYSTPII